MGRSSACLNIITCGRDSAGGSSREADPDVSEIKSSKDKLGWSFRKKSAQQRVLSNSVIIETATYVKKGDLDESAIFSCSGSSDVSGKACLMQCTDNKMQLPVPAESKASENTSIAENVKEFVAADDKAEESAVVLIQAAVRGFLARRKLLTLKDVVKLQSAVEGDLVQKSIPSPEITVAPASVIGLEEKEKSETFETTSGISSDFALETTESKLKKETLVSSESDENLITYEGDKINFHACQSTHSLADDDTEQTSSKIVYASDAIESSSDVHSLSDNQKSNCLDEPQKCSEQLKDEGKKLPSGSGSRNATNIAFISARSKFEELASTANPMSSSSVGSTHHNFGVSNTDRILPMAESAKEERGPNVTQDASLGKIAQYAGSECGTELSISSTLDSPDRSEAGVALDEHVKEIRDEGTQNCDNTGKLDPKSEEKSTDMATHLTEEQLENPDHAREDSDGSVVSIDVSQIEQKLKMSEPDSKKELIFQTQGPSPEASPRSHITHNELQQNTPSNQQSVKPKKDKPNKSSPKPKQKSPSAGKKSPSNPNYEQPPKDRRNRNSFGSDQERRDSTSSNSLPRFMQATESAKAKVHANNGSPRSSPDVQERDIYVKKRHSLPGADGKQVSPRIKPDTKERKWQR